MKKTTIVVLVFVLMSVGFVLSGSAQDKKAAKQIEKTAKDAEKIYQKVKKLGVGDTTSLRVIFFDDTSFSGHISESNDKSFTVVDKNGTSRSINYTEVKGVEGKNTSNGVKIATYVLVGVGAGVLAFVLLYLHTVGKNR